MIYILLRNRVSFKKQQKGNLDAFFVPKSSSADNQKQKNLDSNESDNHSQRCIDSSASGSNVDQNVNVESKPLHLKFNVFISKNDSNEIKLIS